MAAILLLLLACQEEASEPSTPALDEFKTRYVTSAASHGGVVLLSYWNLSGASMSGALARFDFQKRAFTLLRCPGTPRSPFLNVCAVEDGFAVVNIDPKTSPQALFLNVDGECKEASPMADSRGWPQGRRLSHAFGDGQRLWLTFANETRPNELALAQFDAKALQLTLVHERALPSGQTGYWLPVKDRLFFFQRETGVIELLKSSYQPAAVVREGEPMVETPEIRGLKKPKHWSLFMGAAISNEGASLKVNTFLGEDGSSLERPLRKIIGLAANGRITAHDYWILGTDGPNALAHDPKSGAFLVLTRGASP